MHKDKSKIFSIYKGVNLLGFRVFYYYKLLRKRNINQFNKKLSKLEKKYKQGLISYDKFMESINGWLAYAIWGDTYKLRRNILKRINKIFQ